MPSIDVRAPINRVWDLVSDPQRLPDWLGAPEGDLPATVEEGDAIGPWTVDTVREGEELTLRGGLQAIRIQLAPTGDGTRVELDLPGDAEAALDRLQTLAQAEGDTPRLPPQ